MTERATATAPRTKPANEKVFTSSSSSLPVLKMLELCAPAVDAARFGNDDCKIGSHYKHYMNGKSNSNGKNYLIIDDKIGDDFKVWRAKTGHSCSIMTTTTIANDLKSTK